MCLFVFCMVTDFSAAEKGRGVKFCMLAYYPDRSSPLLVNFGSRGVTGAALFPEFPTELGADAGLAPDSADALVCF